MIKVDLHSHSTFSDGILSPTKMVELAKENGAKYYALTDHDTISGLEEAELASKIHNLNFIPGIELSTNYNNESIHILGFFKDNSYKSSEFISFLDEIKNKRLIRAKKMVEKLREHFKIELNYDNLLKRGKDVVARPHIAEEIIKSGYPFTKNQIFDAVWKEEFLGGDNTIMVHISRLRDKIEVDSRNPKHLKTIRGLGYKFEKENNLWLEIQNKNNF